MIICVGPIFLDRVVRIDSFPEKPIKLVANSLEKRLGGPAPVASFAIKSLGGDAEFIGRFGDDDAANFLKSKFDKANIQINKSLFINDAQSSQSHIFEDLEGERMLAVFNEEKLVNVKSLPTFDFSSKQSYLVDTNWVEASHYVAINCYKNKINCVVDLDNFINSKLIEEVVNSASFPIFSEIGLKRYTNKESISDSLESLYTSNPKFYAVTMGPKGVYWINNGEIFHCESPQVKAIETNGAGDVFHGAFIRFIELNKTIKEAIELATACASLKCTRVGGIESLPSFDEVIEFSKHLKLSKKNNSL